MLSVHNYFIFSIIFGVLNIALALWPIGDSDELFQWTCKNNAGFCQKSEITAATRPTAVGLNVCQLTCNPFAGLWPRPTSIEMSDKTLKEVNVETIWVTTARLTGSITDLVFDGSNRFKANAKLRSSNRLLGLGGSQLIVFLDILDNDQRRLTLDTDESYELTVTTSALGIITARIKAKNYFGARHGLETLSQLIVYDTVQNKMKMPMTITITDAPKYPLRGVMVDTSRSYMSVDSLKRTIEGMAASKMNTFHWHISDTHSFPFASTRRPQMTQIGAYAADKIYTPNDIKDIVRYGRVRGVRVIPELDAPAHVGEGWQKYDDNYVACFNQRPWYNYCVEPPCGQLDPTKDGVYDVLGDLFKDFTESFDMDMFHMGGDEVSEKCWMSVPSITQWMDTNGFVNADENWTEATGNPKYMKLWDYFQRKALARFDEHVPNKIPIILWTSHLTNNANIHYLDKDRYIIQIWTLPEDPQVANLLALGFKVIISNFNAMYLDCGFGAWTRGGSNWCSPYKGWQTIYDNRVELVVGNRTDLVLGGETPLWSEQSDDQTIDGRVWPRAAAYGERLWSDPAEGFRDAVTRMLSHRERLVLLGIKAEVLQPEWCYQHEANCPVDGYWNISE